MKAFIRISALLALFPVALLFAWFAVTVGTIRAFAELMIEEDKK